MGLSLNEDVRRNIRKHLQKVHDVRSGNRKVVSLPLMFIFTGESNAGGFSPNSDATAYELTARPSVQILNNTTLTFQPLHVGVNNLIGHAGLSDNVTHGWEIKLANAVEDGRFTQNQAYLVKTGQGGSLALEWAAGYPSNYWSIFLTRMAAALALQPSVTPIVWLTNGINDFIGNSTYQGGPVTPTMPAAWKTAVVTWLAQIRALLGSTTLVIMTEFQAPISGPTGIPTFNAEMVSIAAGDPYTFLVSSLGAPIGSDVNHWSDDGYDIMAERMIDVTFLARGTGQSPAPSISPPSGDFTGQGNVTVTLTGAGELRYTLDTSDPLNGTVYSAPFSVTPPLSITAISVQKNKQSSSQTITVYTAGTVFSATDAAAGGVTITNGDLTITNPNSAWETVRTTSSQASGQRYVEFKVTTNSNNANFNLGFASSGFLINNYLGTSNYSVGLSANGTQYLSTGFSAGSGATPSGNPALNDVWSLAIDFTAGKIWIGKNNTWLAGGNPATGANPAVNFTAATVGALFAAISLFNNGGGWTLQATSAQQKYSAPAGFTAWG
jgi:hypothetical protein